MPSRMRAARDACFSGVPSVPVRGFLGRVRTRATHSPHRAKQAASTRKATGARVSAMTRPPMAGPMMAAVRAPAPISALAGVSSSSSTTEGRMETRRARKKASTVPKAAAAAHSIHTVRSPVSPATPTAVIRAALVQLEATMSVRGDIESPRLPPTRVNRARGTAWKART